MSGSRGGGRGARMSSGSMLMAGGELESRMVNLSWG